METTQTTTRRSGLAERLLGERHSLPLTLALHLVPGVLIVAVYLVLAEPFVNAIGAPTFLGWAIAMVLALAPVQLGLLLWLGYRRNGRISLRGVLKYVDKPVPRGKLVALVAALMVWFTVVALALTPLDNAIFQAFFTWVPFDGAGGSATAYLEGYSQSAMVLTLAVCVPFTGVTLPLIEELYFRGFLLPRIEHLGRWAPVLNTVLFSVYHLWSPWVVVSRVIFFLPGPWLVWRKKDIRLSIGMHVGTTFLTSTLGVLALALGLVP